jgi:hypothetical protein
LLLSPNGRDANNAITLAKFVKFLQNILWYLKRVRSVLKIYLFQHEAKMKSLNETIREGETKKRQLEESLDALQEEVSRYLLYINKKDAV